MIIKDQRNNLIIDTGELEEKLSQITNWQEWHNLEKSLFKLDEWKHADDETIESLGQRDRIMLNGHEWIPLTTTCDVDREIDYIHEMARWYVFEKLEPEAYAENLSEKEEFRKKCAFCLRYTRDFDMENCPFCGRKLTLFSLVSHGDIESADR